MQNISISAENNPVNKL